MRRVSSVLNQDYFGLLGVEPTYALALDELEHRYLEQSKVVHPDRFVNEPAARRVVALQQSMELNKAYNTLRKPVPRAEYLLVRAGLDIGGNEQLAPEFLMEVMEAREELAAAKSRQDASQLGKLRTTMESRRASVVDRVGQLFASWESDADPESLQSIKQQLILLRYVDRYLEQFEDDDED